MRKYKTKITEVTVNHGERDVEKMNDEIERMEKQGWTFWRHEQVGDELGLITWITMFFRKETK